MTMQYVLAGVGLWVVVSVVAGLGMGRVMQHCAQWDGQLAVARRRHTELKKTA